mmetsp:Transcript_94440/g.281902  ORF Transcript_94440/g.281902 Transcript_94440/m.281902 type:complete len:308 (+) Transcript_94440:74-997(+)
MTAVSKSQMLPLLAALAAVLSLGAVAGIKFLMKYLKRMGELNKRRKARLALLASRPQDAPPPKLLHVACYALPDLQDGSEPRRRLDGIVEKMNAAFPCVKTSFSNYGCKTMGKQGLLGFLGKPDMSLSMTHCLVTVADDPLALKLMLHSNIYRGELAATGGPYLRGCTEIVTDLAIDLKPEGKEDAIMEYVLLRFKPEVTDDSEVFQSFLKAVADFNQCPGIAAALQPAGYGKLLQEDVLSVMRWTNQSFVWTHLLVVAADSPQRLKDLMSSEAYGKWLMTEMPHLKQDGGPAAAMFFAPLAVTASC